jgi:hypothetical protein
MTARVEHQTNQQTCPPSSCCPPNDPYVKTAEVIALIVIGTFALCAKPLIFIGALSLGAIYQFAKIELHMSYPENGASRPGCGQGYGEFFSGIKFWPIEVVAVIAALAWEHLQMAPHFYIPFFGFFMGMRATQLTLAPLPASSPCCQPSQK